jgi:hypothetical protein
MTRDRNTHATFPLLLVFAVTAAVAQNGAPNRSLDGNSSAAAPVTSVSAAALVLKPLPDIVDLMQKVEQKQREAEAIQKNYICHSVDTLERTDSAGHVKKTTVSEYDHYWSDGVPVSRLVRKDGKDLSAGELAKEDERIRKEVAKAREHRAKLQAEGKPTNAQGDELVTVSRLLELGRFTNARRTQLDNRDTIAVDYEGNPTAKARNRGEEVFRDLRRTLWVDENDRMLVRMEGYFVDDFKVAGGFLADIRKGTRFQVSQMKINDELWDLSHIRAQGSGRAFLLFNFTGRFRKDYTDYRKLRTSSVVLPGATKVDDPVIEPTAMP